MTDFDEREDDGAFRDRLREHARTAGLTLDVPRIAQFEGYFRLLRHWNRTINLTALPLAGLPDHTLNRLFIEPMQAARFVDDSPLVWFDLGSGGGSPAIPLKIVRPLMTLTMVESKFRKAAFLREAVRLLALSSTKVLSIRIEELGDVDAAGQVNLVTVRAVKVGDELFRLASALLRPQGQLLLFGSRLSREVKYGDLRATDEIDLAGGDSTLQVLRKTG